MGCVLRRDLGSQALGQSFTPGSEISPAGCARVAEALQGSSVTLQSAGAEGGNTQPLGTVPQPREVTVTAGGTSRAGGHPSLGLGSCKNFSISPTEIGFPLSQFTDNPLHSPLTPTPRPEVTDLLKVTY